MSLQPILLVDLVLAALLYAVAAFIYRRKGMRTKRWSLFLGLVLLFLVLVGFFGSLPFNAQWASGTVAVFGGILSIVYAVRWRLPTAQGTEP
jgi:ABC-type iron transport system FetAB permease component